MGSEPLLAEPLGTLPSFPWSSWRQLASSSERGWRGTPLSWTGVQEGLDPPPAPLSTQPSIPNGPKEQLCSAAQPPTPLAQLPPTSEGAGVPSAYSPCGNERNQGKEKPTPRSQVQLRRVSTAESQHAAPRTQHSQN